MECLEAIITRRSIRKFKADAISDAVLNKILEAVRWTPSWANTQCWEFVIVRDITIKKQLQDSVPNRNPAYLAIADAPGLVAICSRLKSSGYYKGEVSTKFGDWFLHDLGLVTQSFCLAAHANGLGSVVVGLFDHDRARKILNAPENIEVVTLIPFGYPAHNPKPPKRRVIAEFVRNNSF